MEISIVWWMVLVLSVSLGVSVILLRTLYLRVKRAEFRNRSQSTRYGRITEQFLPLVDIFPWNPGNFRFLGTPIDGVQFEDDRIILVEFKAANSRLSSLQLRIKDLVDRGKVEFEVIRVR